MRLLLFSFLTALHFLTTLPIPLWREIQGEDIARSVRYFPLVGVILGGILALLAALLGGWLGLSPLAVAVLLVIAHLMLTGALHFDGFLDSCDGLFGYRTPERRLEIMRDSRVGSFAVAGGWALLSLKFVGITQLPPDLLTRGLLIAPLLGRWALVLAVVIFPYGRESGLGLVYKQYNTKRELALAAVGVVLLSGLILQWVGLFLLLAASVLAWLIGRWVMTKLPAGLTGDSYGAIAELTEAVIWLGLSSAAGLLKGFF